MFKDKLVWFWLTLTILFCLALAFFNLTNNTSGYLSFSDSAKFAEIARNIHSGNGFVAMFSFFGGDGFWPLSPTFFSARGVSVFTPFVVSLFYGIFGINDYAVIITSLFFFGLTLVFTYLLSNKIFNNSLVAILSTLAVGTNNDMINYARLGASESPFIFEIVASFYFFSLQKKWAIVVGFVFILAIYLTRPQGFIYILGVILFWLLRSFKITKAVSWFCFIVLIGIVVDKFLITNLPENLYLISILDRGGKSLTYYLQDSSVSDPLRGVKVTSQMIDIAKKTFYNLYNFYKLAPQIINPYLLLLFILGVLTSFKNKIYFGFKLSTLFILLLSVFVVASSIPLFRYLHPVVPLIYIIAVGTLIEIFNEFSILKFKITKKIITIIVPTVLIMFFAVGQTLGIIFLDSRFEKKMHNIGKPPIYVVLSQKLKENTNATDVVITNLDTWGSWYGERKTVWFPIEPKQIIYPETMEIPFDSIYLTSYLIDDSNYYMGDNWRLILDNPMDVSRWACDGCDKIAKEFSVKNIIEIPATDVYENKSFEAVLLVKR